MISLNEEVLAEKMCNFAEELWGLPDIAVTDWGDSTIEHVGSGEEADLEPG